MNGLNGSMTVLTTSSSASTVSTVIAADPDKINNNDNNNISNMDISSSQIITELSNEDRFMEHEEYSTGKVKVTYARWFQLFLKKCIFFLNWSG